MKNWKTTLGGILLALGTSLMGMDVFPAEYHWVPEALSAIGGVILGISAKDNNVHSTYEEVYKSTVKKK